MLRVVCVCALLHAAKSEGQCEAAEAPQDGCAVSLLELRRPPALTAPRGGSGWSSGAAALLCALALWLLATAPPPVLLMLVNANADGFMSPRELLLLLLPLLRDPSSTLLLLQRQ